MRESEEPNRRRDFGSLRLRGRIWWLRYRVDGKEHWESSRSTSERVAAKLLAQRETELGHGMLVAPQARRVTFEDLEGMLRTHYLNRALRSLPRLEGALTHLREAFGSTRALAITADRIADYESVRLAAGAARATVNYELAALRKAFNLAVRARRIPSRPPITTPIARNARTGFFEPDEFAAVIAELPEYLQPVMRFAYLTGWRVRAEVLPLTWDRVDFAAGVVRLDPNTTKSDEGRTFPFDVLPDLAELLQSQRERTKALERSTSRVIARVFHRNGAPIRNFYKAWKSACKRAAKGKRGAGELASILRPQLLERLAHDFRRTAVRNLVRAGVPERVAMDLCGHKTRSIFDRYNIVNEADLRAGVAKLAEHLRPAPKSTKGTKGGQSAIRSVGGRAD